MKSLTERIIESQVAVRHIPSRRWISFIPCPGEERVRIDVYDSLDNYEVLPVEYLGEDAINFKLRGSTPVPYTIDYS